MMFLAGKIQIRVWQGFDKDFVATDVKLNEFDHLGFVRWTYFPFQMFTSECAVNLKLECTSMEFFSIQTWFIEVHDGF